MNTPTPTPRLVPDRPSIAVRHDMVPERLNAMADDLERGPWTAADAANGLRNLARMLAAAAPPAEAPAERGDAVIEVRPVVVAGAQDQKFTVEVSFGNHGMFRNVLRNMQNVGWNIDFTEGSGFIIRPFFVRSDRRAYEYLKRILP